jgi:hypothetical protein
MPKAIRHARSIRHLGWLDARSMSRYIDPSRSDARNVVSGLL